MKKKSFTADLKKILKITFSVIFVFVCSLKTEIGYSQNIPVTLSMKNTSLSEVLNEIEKQTDYLFIINSNINTRERVSVDAKNQPVSEVLKLIFKDSDIRYSQEGNHIVLSRNPLLKETLPDKKELVITGTVVDENNETLPGVSILYKGTTLGTITDIDGNYSLKAPDGNGQLLFSYIGYKPIEISINNRSVINVTISEDTQVLAEVVVTAMGIERKAKSLTYATQQVDGRELTRAKESNFINSLQGKSSGLVITPNASGAGGSSKLLLRGNSSVLGTNEPLIVLDGVPMARRLGTQITDDLLAGGNGNDGGDGLSNINPDDIASITVLKGANAAALYGAAAGNGVVIITTKKGYEGRVRIDISSNFLYETPLITPRFQNAYGADWEDYEDVSLNPNQLINKRRLAAMSWGAPIGLLSNNMLNEIPYARNEAMDNVDAFLRPATNFNNTISVSAGTPATQTYFSYGYTSALGLIPNNSFGRHNATFRQNVNLFQGRLKLDFSGSYIIQQTDNRPGSGTYANSLYSLYIMPRNADVRYFKHHSEVRGDLYYKTPIGDFYPNTGFQGPVQQWPWIEGSDDTNSPYWYMNRLNKVQKRERMYATIGATVDIMTGLKAQTRLKIDRTNDSNETKTWKGTKAKEIYNSIYENAHYTSDQMYADFLISYNKKVNDFDLSANVGGSTQKDNYDNMDIVYWMNDSTAVPNKFTLNNIVGKAMASDAPSISRTSTENWENALYATAQVGYKEIAYIDLTVRRDWARTFTQFKDRYGTDGYYTYYSAGGNVFLDQFVPMNPDKINQMKLRLSYSEVGTPLPNEVFDAARLNYGAGSAVAGQYRDFDNPGPERVHSTELGLDGRLFNRTIDFDVTLYNSLMKNQWLPKPAATGGMIPLNSGRIRNQGIETTVSYTFMPTADFSWKTTVNYSYNTNKILETYGKNGNDVIEINPIFQGGLRIRYEVGKPYGELYGRTFKYKEDGTIQVNRNGAPVLSSDYDHYLGNANSPHHASWGNNFNYRDFFFYFLIDGKIGGKVISYTEAKLDYFGVSERTGDARNAGIIYMKRVSMAGETLMEPVPGIIMPDGNIAPIEGYYQAIGGGEPALGEYTYNATNFRMREVSVGYTFRSLFGTGNDLNISLVGRNLFFIHKQSPVDPDVSVSSANSFGGIEAFSLPTTRSYGINLKASF